jgi:hypothetical protein
MVKAPLLCAVLIAALFALGWPGAGVAQTATPKQTIGSWTILGSGGMAEATLTDAAVVVASAPVAGPSGPKLSAPLIVHFTSGPVRFQDSRIVVNILDAPAGFAMPGTLPIMVIADGKVMAHFNLNDPKGASLTDLFGADLAGLGNVKTFEVALDLGGQQVPIFRANLSDTAAAIAAAAAAAKVTAGVAAGSGGTFNYGSWKFGASLNGAWAQPDGPAVVTASAQVGSDKTIKPSSVFFLITYDDFYSDITAQAAVDVPPDQRANAVLRVFADGKQIDLIHSNNFNQFYGTPLPLMKYFGEDMKGLIPVRNFKAVVTSGGADTVIYEVNFSGTAFVLSRLPELWKNAEVVPKGRPLRKSPPLISR